MNKISKFDLIKKIKNMSILGSLLLLMAFSCVSTANAYQLKNYKWPQPSTTFYVSISGADGLWDDSFEGAMDEWSAATVFQFDMVRGTYESPCDATEGRNGVAFSSTDCGDAWGSATLAVTHSWYYISTSTTFQTDIIFNSNLPWNVYSTSWASGSWVGINDFRRVAVHELGHALGLAHEDNGVSTIMGTYAGDITTPQQDDINGVAALYGGGGTYYGTYEVEIGFDPEFYLNKYSDLADAGYTKENVKDHWLVCGIYEGRQGSSWFDAVFYLQQYPDLQQAYGNDYYAAFTHWLYNGIYEGRQGSEAFDPVFYLQNYPDLQQAFGNDYYLALYHWIYYGVYEGRQGVQ